MLAPLFKSSMKTGLGTLMMLESILSFLPFVIFSSLNTMESLRWCVYVCVHLCMHVRVCACMYMSDVHEWNYDVVYVCMYMYTYIYVCIYIYIYIYI